jgi:regulation of enolase protein 1 (concanavalin A-like superfamily)
VLWKDESNYLRLDQGVLARGHVSFGGCVGNRDFTAGRGRLGTDRVLLRLERSDGGVRALASADGDTWHLVGTVAFPVEDQIEVGVFADGAIRPEVYLRALSGGSTIRFTNLKLSRLRGRGGGPWVSA